MRPVARFTLATACTLANTLSGPSTVTFAGVITVLAVFTVKPAGGAALT